MNVCVHEGRNTSTSSFGRSLSGVGSHAAAIGVRFWQVSWIPTEHSPGFFHLALQTIENA
jgi:hypothetical protein